MRQAFSLSALKIIDRRKRLSHLSFSVCTLLVACARAPVKPADILLFNGTGVSAGSAEALEDILKREHLNYALVDSGQFNAITEAQLRRYKLLIVPGGNFEQIGNSLAPETSASVRAAIYKGVNYLGVCAGAFFAGNSPFNGLNLTGGRQFGFYSAESQGIHKTAVPVETADGDTLDHYWEDGPQLSGWGVVIGRYPDNTPAIVEGRVGKGWVLLTGIHAEAGEKWRSGMEFKTTVEADNAYAAKLIHAALTGEELPHY